METSILQKFKNKAGKFIEPKLLKTGRVLEVRTWETGEMIEVDLHLPFAEVHKWNEVPYIKIQVDNLCFRDYTPFGWDADTATCSLLINTGHNGPGSSWANQLKAGDTVHYLKIDGTRQSPHPTDLVVGLGDTSSMAHVLALQQLTMPTTRFDGAILSESAHTGRLFKNYFRSPLATLPNRAEMTEWLTQQGYCTTHTWFYLTGNAQLVSELRRLLKGKGYYNIQVQGFWS